MTLVRFRIAGIPVDVQVWFLVVVGMSAFQLRSPPLVLIWIATATTSVLWHELGHAVTMRRFGYPPRIELHAMGGLAHWPPGANPSARQALLVDAAGPFAGLLLGAVVWSVGRGAGPLPYLARVAVDWVVWVNIAWSLFNLLPLPLDGGNLLDHLSERPGEPMQWLRRAIDAGLDCGAMLETEPALEPLRSRAEFIELVQRTVAAKARA